MPGTLPCPSLPASPITAARPHTTAEISHGAAGEGACRDMYRHTRDNQCELGAPSLCWPACKVGSLSWAWPCSHTRIQDPLGTEKVGKIADLEFIDILALPLLCCLGPARYYAL